MGKFNIVLLFLIGFIASTAYGQTNTYDSSGKGSAGIQDIKAPGYSYKHLRSTGGFWMPYDTVKMAVADSNGLAVKNKVLYMWDGYRWNQCGGSGSGGGGTVVRDTTRFMFPFVVDSMLINGRMQPIVSLMHGDSVLWDAQLDGDSLRFYRMDGTTTAFKFNAVNDLQGAYDGNASSSSNIDADGGHLNIDNLSQFRIKGQGSGETIPWDDGNMILDYSGTGPYTIKIFFTTADYPDFSSGSLTAAYTYSGGSGTVTVTYAASEFGFYRFDGTVAQIPTGVTSITSGSFTPPTVIIQTDTTGATPDYYLGAFGDTIRRVPAPDLSSGWSINGNDNITFPDNFIGTTTRDGIAFKINNTKAGMIDPDDGNTSLGYDGLKFTGTIKNTGVGYETLKRATTGSSNVAVGFDALPFLTSGSLNCGVGQEALISLTTGDNNVSVGGGSGTNITTGSDNTMIGKGANVSGATNTHSIALGSGAVADSYEMAIDTLVTKITAKGLTSVDIDTTIRKPMVWDEGTGSMQPSYWPAGTNTTSLSADSVTVSVSGLVNINKTNVQNVIRQIDTLLSKCYYDLTKVNDSTVGYKKLGGGQDELTISGLSPAYKYIYRCNLTQSGSSAPVATVFENTFANDGITLTWYRDGAGSYTLGASSAVFASGKVWKQLDQVNAVIAGNIATGFTQIVSTNAIGLYIQDLATGSTDGLLTNTSFILLVYP